MLQGSFYVRASSDSRALFATLRSIIANLDPSLPVMNMKTLDTQLDEVLNTERLIASLSVVFGVVATALAALGLYGVVAFSVASRTKEIGVRMALGAPKISVLWLILRETMILVTIGIAIGMPVAYVLSRYVTSQLYGVTPTDVVDWSCSASDPCRRSRGLRIPTRAPRQFHRPATSPPPRIKKKAPREERLLCSALCFFCLF